MNRNRTVVRRFHSGDVDALERIALAAYGYPMSPGMRARLAGDHATLVAERGDTVVGCVLLADYGAVGYVGSMAVDPGVHRSGAGTALMEALIALAAQSGIESLALDATEMGAPLYERFGFLEIDRTLVLERRATPSATSLRSPDESSFERLVELDRELLGCDRKAALSMLASEQNVTVSLDPRGYAMTRADVLGPWLASSPEASQASPGIRRMFVPEMNGAALSIADMEGYRRTRSLRHMVRGSPVLPRMRIFGQASLGHG